jgi:protocatechuate 3,4-dioxygenase beta subunit
MNGAAIKSAGVAMLLALAPLANMRAQSAPRPGPTGIEGHVTDTLGKPVPGVSIRIHGPQGKRDAQTDSLGYYHFLGIVSGPYAVEVTMNGLTKELAQHTYVEVYRMTRFDIVLKITICPPEDRLTCKPAMVEARNEPEKPQG